MLKNWLARRTASHRSEYDAINTLISCIDVKPDRTLKESATYFVVSQGFILSYFITNSNKIEQKLWFLLHIIVPYFNHVIQYRTLPSSAKNPCSHLQDILLIKMFAQFSYTAYMLIKQMCKLF